MRWNVLLRAFGIDGEQHHGATLETHGIDDTYAAAFAHAGTGPSDFATPAGPREQVPSFGVDSQVSGELAMLLSRPVVRPELAKEWRLDDGQHRREPYAIGA